MEDPSSTNQVILGGVGGAPPSGGDSGRSAPSTGYSAEWVCMTERISKASHWSTMLQSRSCIWELPRMIVMRPLDFGGRRVSNNRGGQHQESLYYLNAYSPANLIVSVSIQSHLHILISIAVLVQRIFTTKIHHNLKQYYILLVFKLVTSEIFYINKVRSTIV